MNNEIPTMTEARRDEIARGLKRAKSKRRVEKGDGPERRPQCPDCGSILAEVYETNGHGNESRRYLCKVAIGETYRTPLGVYTFPADSKHHEVKMYTADEVQSLKWVTLDDD